MHPDETKRKYNPHIHKILMVVLTINVAEVGCMAVSYLFSFFRFQFEKVHLNQQILKIIGNLRLAPSLSNLINDSKETG